MSPRIEVLPVAGALGAELRGVDLSQKLDDPALAGVLEALYEHKVIFFRGQTLTPGLPAAEGDALLAFLFQHQNQPEFQCRWRWQAGDVAVWDNRATQHYAVADYGGEPRTIHRVTLEGEAPA